MLHTFCYFRCAALIPVLCPNILFTLGFPIFIRGVEYTISVDFLSQEAISNRLGIILVERPPSALPVKEFRCV